MKYLKLLAAIFQVILLILKASAKQESRVKIDKERVGDTLKELKGAESDEDRKRIINELNNQLNGVLDDTPKG